MEIVQNRAVLVNTRKPHLITEVVSKATVVKQTPLPNGQMGSTVAVPWTLRYTKILHNLGFKKVPSPITGKYEWPGLYKPFSHQRDTAAFLTLHPRAFCLNDMGCVDSETEYLSPTGWVKISEYTGGQVAQFHPETGMVDFVEPYGYLKKPCETMVHFKTKCGIDQMLSLEHRMLIHDNASKEGKWVVMSAAEMKDRHDAALSKSKITRSSNSVSFSHASCPTTFSRGWGEGLTLSEAELRLQIAVIADGHFPSGSNRCVVRLKKTHKIDRMSDLLMKAGVDFDARKQDTATAKGFVVFIFDAPMRVKEFDGRFYQCSQQQIDVIYDEVLRWDGCYRKGGRLGEFSAVSKTSADFIQMVFNSKGHIARITEDRRQGKYRGGVCYVVRIREQGSGLLAYKSTTTETAHYRQSTDGFKYCFTVPTSFLLFRRNGCVFASGNTGKTCSVAWAADYLMNLGVIKRVLIVAPLSILDCAWRADLFKTLMHRRVDIAHGSAAKRRAVIASDAEFVAINYDGLEVVHKELMEGGFDLIVCDEASALKTHTTKRWKLMNQLVRPETWLWLLTGTPAAQSPDEAYGLARLVNPSGVPRFYGSFRDQVMLKVTQFRYVPRPEAQQIVHKALQPAIRFTKEECLDLPEMTYVDREVPLTAQQAKYYEKLKHQLLIQAAGEEVSAINAAVEMNKLMQISCIAYNTPVLTEFGWIPIQYVTPLHKVWDGEEWVRQDGAVFRGEKPVEKCYGVDMTLDHKVLTDSGWETAEEINYGKPSIRPNRAIVRVPDGYRTSWNDDRNFSPMRDVAMPVQLWATGDSVEPVFKIEAQETPKKLRLPPRQRNAQNESYKSLFKLSKHAPALSRSYGQGLQKLRGTWDCCMQTLAVFVRDILVGHGAYAQGWAYSGQDRQQRAIFTRELPMGYPNTTGAQHEGERPYRYTEGGNDCSTSSGGVRAQVCHLEKTTEGGLAYRFSSDDTTRQKQKTYDLLNCGPRSRFVVAGKEGPIIVHNCGAVYSDTGAVVEFDCTNRLNELVDIVEQASHKTLIFANFTHSIDTIQRHLSKHGITNASINGAVSLSKRSEIIESFQKTNDIQVLVIQPQAASHGITLHAANTVIWWGPIPSLEYYLQANARVHRAGQKNPCTVVHLMGSGVEKQMYKRLQGKKDDQESLLAMYKNVIGLT
jgi:superfamily II DNA or RNA helicase